MLIHDCFNNWRNTKGNKEELQEKNTKIIYSLYSEITITSVSKYIHYSFDIFRMYHACRLVD